MFSASTLQSLQQIARVSLVNERDDDRVTAAVVGRPRDVYRVRDGRTQFHHRRYVDGSGRSLRFDARLIRRYRILYET